MATLPALFLLYCFKIYFEIYSESLDEGIESSTISLNGEARSGLHYETVV